MSETKRGTPPVERAWQKAVAKHRKPVMRSSVWQLVNSLAPYLALWGLMIWTLNISYWITLAIGVVASGFLVRIFIIFHDCGHGSFFKSRRANRVTEFITGVLTFTPYRQWRHDHALHHANAGDLDRRGPGDIWTLTVREYLGAPLWKRLSYRVVRNPFVLLVVAPLFVFVVQYRFPSRAGGKRERIGVFWTDCAMLAIVALMSLTIGFKAYVLIQLPVIMLAGTAGVWLFYVQHQFEDVQWKRGQEWDYEEAAFSGSSYFELPRILQWFTGNIGFHHIHHLSPAIPNYRLERCHRENPMFQKVPTVTLWSSLKSLSIHLWDEKGQELIGFGQLKAIRRDPQRHSLSTSSKRSP